MNGQVYLIGAGPGDPGLITVKAVECLRRADVVVYDRLVAPVLLDYARADAEKIYVGKASSDHTLPQNEINTLLVQKAREGKIIARLKGGDLFVFGRGGEEALALVDAGIEFEIVPGISSAIAAPAYAGIPVTHRGVATSFTVATGHFENSEFEIRNSETRIFLMGVENLERIVESLQDDRVAANTPAALVRWGTTTQQETRVGTLENIVEVARGLQPPAVLIVGNVVALREKLQWFEARPLFGKRILVTRAREQASEFSRMLRDLGAEPIEFPVIRIAPLDDYHPLDDALTQHYDWVIFTSVNGVNAVWHRLAAIGRDARAFAGTKLCAIGPATAEQLASHGLRADFVPRDASRIAEGIVADIGDVNGKRVLLPRADIARENLAHDLRARGAIVDEVVAYRTVTIDANDPSAQHIRDLLAAGEIDAITFTSSSTVRGFCSVIKSEIENRKLKIVCIGPITAQTARDLGLRVDVTAREYMLEGLTRALVSCWKEGWDADTGSQRER
ncbi:MAG: uroporphyrinogen-III C-methyltransferase [Chloroflexi bacterium]|nr:uroporphyrinogen-III C-methyltransferase [Chloroflexota bacterium]